MCVTVFQNEVGLTCVEFSSQCLFLFRFFANTSQKFNVVSVAFSGCLKTIFQNCHHRLCLQQANKLLIYENVEIPSSFLRYISHKPRTPGCQLLFFSILELPGSHAASLLRKLLSGWRDHLALRTFPTFAEDWGLVPSNRARKLTIAGNSNLRGNLAPSSGL